MAKSKEKPKEKPKAKVAPKADIDNGSTVLNSLTDGVGSVEVEAVDVKALAQRALDLVGTGSVSHSNSGVVRFYTESDFKKIELLLTQILDA
jgi:hypothetical protein|tara:strand:+ start:240 stop:515 length:276 start_codon:yes stop_codon:yes gene_type:complete